MMTRQELKRDILMQTAFAWSRASTAKRSKVGCVLSKDNRILATGYNGTIPGEDNCCETDDGVTKDTVTHAEQNALMYCAKKGIAVEGCSLYVTMMPCITCARLLIAAGIKEVFYSETYRLTDGVELLNAAKIRVIKL